MSEIDYLDKTIGFSRRMEDLQEVKPYDLHIFICTDVPVSHWGEKAWRHPYDEITQRVNKWFQDPLRNHDLVKATVNITNEEGLPPISEAFDLIAFIGCRGGGVGYRAHGVQTDEIDQILTELVGLIQGGTPNDRLKRLKTKADVFICCDELADKRCGFCGGRLLNEFKTRLTSKNLQTEVAVRGITHVQGDTNAGVVIVFPSGNWYGNVTPKEVEQIIEDEIIRGKEFPPLLKGHMSRSSRGIRQVLIYGVGAVVVGFLVWRTWKAYQNSQTSIQMLKQAATKTKQMID